MCDPHRPHHCVYPLPTNHYQPPKRSSGPGLTTGMTSTSGCMRAGRHFSSVRGGITAVTSSPAPPTCLPSMPSKLLLLFLLFFFFVFFSRSLARLLALLLSFSHSLRLFGALSGTFHRRGVAARHNPTTHTFTTTSNNNIQNDNSTPSLFYHPLPALPPPPLCRPSPLLCSR